MSARTYRAGDVVRHRELGEEWLLACDEEHGRVAACGWPESWNRVEEVELVLEASDDERLERLKETARGGTGSRGAAAREQLKALTTEKPLDAIARRAKALGWRLEPQTSHRPADNEWLRLTKDGRSPGSMRYVSYVAKSDGGAELFSGSDLCPHERALLESDGAELDALRTLHGQLAQTEALVADMRAQIERLTALVTGGGA